MSLPAPGGVVYTSSPTGRTSGISGDCRGLCWRPPNPSSERCRSELDGSPHAEPVVHEVVLIEVRVASDAIVGGAQGEPGLNRVADPDSVAPEGIVSELELPADGLLLLGVVVEASAAPRGDGDLRRDLVRHAQRGARRDVEGDVVEGRFVRGPIGEERD